MPDALSLPLAALRLRAAEAALRAYAPFSGRPDAVVLLLADGRTVPGVRVESAAYPLTIPALQNALTSAYALAPGVPVVALAASAPLSAADAAFAEDALGPLTAPASDVRTVPDALLPTPGADVVPVLEAHPDTPEAAVELARAIALRAHVPASDFRVGCVVATVAGFVPGCNVEFADWTRTLCAERNALGTVVSYGLGAPSAVYLACRDAIGSPCGACRQVLSEQAAGCPVWMPGADGLVETTPEALLPGAFGRDALGK